MLSIREEAEFDEMKNLISLKSGQLVLDNTKVYIFRNVSIFPQKCRKHERYLFTESYVGKQI